MEERKITVIIPIYNAEKCLDACLLSIAGQTWRNMEILLINDGSVDHSYDICKSWCEKDSRFRLICQDNRGVSSARNKGLDEAAGEMIAFVDADDRLANDMFEVLAGDLDDTGADLAGCSFVAWSRPGLLPDPGIGSRKRVLYPDSRAVSYLDGVFLSGETRIWSKLFLRSAIGALRFDPKLTVGEDMLFLLDILLQGKKVCLNSYRGYYYYINEEGAMLRQFKPSYMDQIDCWKEAKRRLERQGIDLEVKLAEVRMIAVMLTVGKIAVVSDCSEIVVEKRSIDREKKEGCAGMAKENVSYVNECHSELKQCFQIKGAFNRLSAGHKIKSLLFLLSPKFYLFLYKHWKK